MKINYEDKSGIVIDPQVPAKSKVTDGDMNEIKLVVNKNADTLDANVEAVQNYSSGFDTRCGSLESAVTNINGEITDIQDDIQNILNDTYTTTEVDTLLNEKANVTALNEEITARENADTNLQGQIDAIVASSDVVDIVGTYQELLDYDTSHLGNNDIIKVLDDSTHNNATSYYRWLKGTSTWQYIGSEGPYYTKSETDALLNGKVNVVEGKGLSENDFTDALKSKLDNIESNAQVNKIESIKVNNVTQTITSKSVNINVPTKTSDITNNSGYITKDVNNLTNYTNNTNLANTYQTKSNLVTSISSSSTDTQYPSAKCVYDLIGDIDTALDLLNGEVVS